MYNIIFTLGDLYDNYEEYQFQSNYDVDDIYMQLIERHLKY